MKKIVQIVTAFAFAFIVLSGGASAVEATQCYITNTGPDSTSTCTNTENLSCQVDNNTIISINNNNVQKSDTGEETDENNTSVTYVSTGPASNDNTSAVNGTIINGSCVPAQVIPGGQGSGTTTVATTAAPAPVKVTALPKTSSASTLAYVGGLIVTLGVVAVASRVGVFAYSRIKG